MRSLWYLVTGRPLNLDDCLDLAGSQTVSEVSMELRLYESFREMFSLIQYAVRLTWVFGTREITHEKILVGHIDFKGEIKEASIEKANHCLEQYLGQIERMRICVHGGKQRFTQPPSSDVVRIHAAHDP